MAERTEQLDSIWVYPLTGVTVTNGVIVPGKILDVSLNLHFAGWDSTIDSYYSRSDVYYDETQVGFSLSEDFSTGGSPLTSLIGRDDLTGCTIYIGKDTSVLENDITTAGQIHDQIYPEDLIRLISGTITFTYEASNNQLTQKIFFGNSKPKSFYFGSQEVKQIFLGSNLIWERGIVYPENNSIVYSYDRRNKKLTITLNQMDEKTQLRFDDGRLYAQINTRRCYRLGKLLELTDFGYMCEDETSRSLRGRSRPNYATFKRIPLTTKTTIIDLSDITKTCERTMRRRVDHFGASTVEFVDFTAHLCFLPVNTFDLSMDEYDGYAWRYLKGSNSGAPYRISFNDTYDTVDYDYINYSWSDGIFIAFPSQTLPSGCVGIGVEGDAQFGVRFSDENGTSVSYDRDDIKNFYWMKASDSYSWSNFHLLSEETPIPANTAFRILVYTPGHMENIYNAELGIKILTRKSGS